MAEKDTILINIMYTGDYTNKNIGHEIINLYQTDQKENYIYISPYGRIYKDRYKEVKNVLFARPARTNTLEIIAKAENLEPLNQEKNISSEELKNSFYEICVDKNFAEWDDKRKVKFYIEQILEDNGLAELTPDEIEQKLYYDWLVDNYKKEDKGKSLKTITDKYIMSRKIVTPSEIRNIQCNFIIKQLSDDEYKSIINLCWNSSEVTKIKEKFFNNDNITEIPCLDILKQACEELNSRRNSINKISRLNEEKIDKLKRYKAEELKSEDDVENEYKKTKNYRSWENYRKLNRYQVEELINNSNSHITYGGVELDKIMTNNKWNDTAAYFTFKAKNVRRTAKNIYLKYTSPNTDENKEEPILSATTGNLDKNEAENAFFEAKDENKSSVIYKFHNIRFRNQSCMKYVSKNSDENKFTKQLNLNELKHKKGEKYIHAVLTELINTEDYWINESNEDKIIKPINIKEQFDFEPCFLDIAGNQNDELTYSNLFAYIFRKYKNIFEKFVRDKVNGLGIENFTIESIYEVNREENNIDILIYTEKDLFVIENKIKSHINGEKFINNLSVSKEDSSIEQNEGNVEQQSNTNSQNDNEYTNQLIKYYYYTESKANGRNTHYFIFKPDYNDTEQELEDKINENKPSDEVEKIIKLYEHINYSKIYSFFDSNRPQDTDFYFDEFVKALKRHKNSTDNTIELEMEYKFRQAIEKASNK